MVKRPVEITDNPEILKLIDTTWIKPIFVAIPEKANAKTS